MTVIYKIVACASFDSYLCFPPLSLSFPSSLSVSQPGKISNFKIPVKSFLTCSNGTAGGFKIFKICDMFDLKEMTSDLC